MNTNLRSTLAACAAVGVTAVSLGALAAPAAATSFPTGDTTVAVPRIDAGAVSTGKDDQPALGRAFDKHGKRLTPADRREAVQRMKENNEGLPLVAWVGVGAGVAAAAGGGFVVYRRKFA